MGKKDKQNGASGKNAKNVTADPAPQQTNCKSPEKQNTQSKKSKNK